MAAYSRNFTVIAYSMVTILSTLTPPIPDRGECGMSEKCPDFCGTSARTCQLFMTLLIWVLPVCAIFALLVFVMRHERLATFQVGRSSINVYAEGAFRYEPPGFIYFELKQNGQTVIPQRRFMPIGGERKPAKNFSLIKTSDEEVIAIVLDNEVQMIHEFSSGYTWPGLYTNVTEPQWQMAELLLQRLRDDNPELRCSRQTSYRQELDRRQAK